MCMFYPVRIPNIEYCKLTIIDVILKRNKKRIYYVSKKGI